MIVFTNRIQHACCGDELRQLLKNDQDRAATQLGLEKPCPRMGINYIGP
jgi:hypothetical protein